MKNGPVRFLQAKPLRGQNGDNANRLNYKKEVEIGNTENTGIETDHEKKVPPNVAGKGCVTGT